MVSAIGSRVHPPSGQDCTVNAVNTVRFRGGSGEGTKNLGGVLIQRDRRENRKGVLSLPTQPNKPAVNQQRHAPAKPADLLLNIDIFIILRSRFAILFGGFCLVVLF